MASQLVQLINWPLTQLFTLLLWPLRTLAPIWPLCLLAAGTGILLLWLFGKVSRQDAIRPVRERIRGNLLGVRLYQHDVRVVLGLQGRILRDTLIYLKYAFVPMLILIVPVILILAQVNLRFAQRPLLPGDTTIVKVTLHGSTSRNDDVGLHTPAGIVVETPGVRIPASGEIAWRIRAEQAGHHTLKVRMANREVDKHLWVGAGWGAVPVLRTWHIGQALLYPGEPLLGSGADIAAIEIRYPPLALFLFGIQVHWLALFLCVSLLVGFACKRLLGVEI